MPFGIFQRHKLILNRLQVEYQNRLQVAAEWDETFINSTEQHGRSIDTDHNKVNYSWTQPIKKKKKNDWTINKLQPFPTNGLTMKYLNNFLIIDLEIQK